jgi:N-methylhydantoinase B
MRAEIRRIPDGVYRSEAFVDSDGVVNEPLRIALAVTKRDETLPSTCRAPRRPARGR